MEKNVAILEMKALHSLSQFSDEMRVGGSVVDDASLEVLLRIEFLMLSLPVTADDHGRQMAITVSDQLGRLHHLQLLSACFHDFHYLMLTEGKHVIADLRSAAHLGARRGNSSQKRDVKPALLALESYIAHALGEDPQESSIILAAA